MCPTFINAQSTKLNHNFHDQPAEGLNYDGESNTRHEPEGTTGNMTSRST